MSVLFVTTGTFSGSVLDFSQKYLTVVRIGHKNLLVSMMLRLLLLEEMIIGFAFGGMTKSQAVNRMKNSDLSEKSGQL